MQKPVVCQIDEQIFSCGSAESDRFTYSNYFNPLELQYEGSDALVLTSYQKDFLRAAVQRDPALAQAMATSPSWAEMLEHNSLTELVEEARISITSDRHVEVAGEERQGVERRAGTALAGDSIAELVKSDLGYLFLDRTRIRPVGFATGEHVYTLSLAPGEELVLEQKTFSKRQVTFEQQDESEAQYDIELLSTLSTELQEGLEWQQSRNSSAGFTAGGSLGGTIKGVDVGVNLAYSNNTSDASTQTRSRSIKDSSSSSSRVAARYRTQHKITFRISSESGFESTSKRVVRNPNKYTPISLHYFKILQLLQLSQERYGVRLCWAPAIKDPGFDLFKRIREGRDAILAKLNEVPLPPMPARPERPQKPAIWSDSGEVEATDWGVMDDMSADYDIVIPTPDPQYVWDGNGKRVKESVNVRAQNVDRGWGYNIVGEPWVEDGKVKIKVHVGVDWHLLGKRGKIYIRAGAEFIPGPDAEDPDYREAYKQWQQEMKTWTAKVSQIRADALRELSKEADACEEQMLRSVNPISEMMNRIIKVYFKDKKKRSNAWQIELWQQIFDWDAAGYTLYPSWWRPDVDMREPLRPPTHFFNASWAKMYIPVRIGFERQALRWICGGVVDTPLEPATEAAFDRLINDLRRFRIDSFGDAYEAPIEPIAGKDQLTERFLCLARWSERIPTDGTHVEVVQSSTDAADAYSRSEIQAATQWQAALLAEKQREIELLGEQVEAAKHGVTLAAQDVELRKQDVALKHELAQSAHHDLTLKQRSADLIKGSIGVQVQVATLGMGNDD